MSLQASRLGVALLLACASPLLLAADVDPQALDAVEVKGKVEGRRLHKPARTATRLNLSTRQTPASVDVITQDDLRKRGETTAIEALENAPGIVPAWSFGVINVTGRGFSGVFNSPTLFDGIRYPGWQVTPRLTLNYQQIEVLRGPAALAAGQGSVAGAINLVPRRADGQEGGQIYLGLGRYATQTMALGYGGQLGGALNYRLDASYQGSNERGSYGYARNTSFEFFHVSGELAAPVSDTLTLSLAFESFEDDAEGYFGSPLINGRLDERLRDINYNVVDDYVTMRVNWLRARAEWTPDADTAGRFIVYANNEDRGYQNTEVYTWQPASNTVRRSDYLHIAHDQELAGAYADLSHQHSLFGLPHQWVVGLQFDQNAHDRYSDSPFRYSNTVALQPGNRGVYTSLDVYGLRTATDIDQSSVFLESALDLSERFKLVSGYRHDRSQVDSFNALTQVQFDKRYTASSYRMGLVYSPNADLSWYGSVSTSSEPPAQITTLGLANAAFDLTDSDQIELGLKQATRWGEWTLAVYDLSRTNILSRDPADPNRLIQIGEQAARGVELGLRAELAEGWTLDLGASALNAQFERFDERVGSALVSRKGNVPVAVPEQMATAWLHWQALPQLTLSAGARAVGRSAANTANTVWLPGYATMDLGARYDSDVGAFALRVRNVADRYYATRPYGPQQFMTGEPRWVELSWQRSF